MAAVPIPASLVNVPLETPMRTVDSTLPTAPPVTAPGSMAPRNIEPKASANSALRSASAARHRRMYPELTTGTRISAASQSRLAPPAAITATNTASTSPSPTEKPRPAPAA